MVSEGVSGALARGFQLDRTSGVPLAQQIERVLRYRLAGGEIPPGSALPRVRELAQALGVSSATVGRTYARLKGEGLLVVTPRAGAVAATAEASRSPERWRSFVGHGILDDAIARMRKQGLEDIEIRALLRAESDQLMDRAQVVFVALSGSSMLDHVERLRAELATECRVSFDPVTVESLREGDPAAASSISGSDLILTTIFHRSEIAAKFPSRSGSIMVMMTELAPAIHDKLSVLASSQKRTALVTGEAYASSSVDIMLTHGIDAALHYAERLSQGDLRKAISDCDAVVYTRDVAALIQPVLGSRQSVELHFRIRDDSVNRLRRYLERDLGL